MVRGLWAAHTAGMDADEPDDPAPSRPARVVIGAFAGGTIGVFSGALVIEWRDPGPPDMSMEMLIGMCIGGGLGWIAGAAIGWIGGRNRPSPLWITRVVLLALIAPMAWLGMVAIGEARHGGFGPMIDDAGPRDPRRDQLASSIAVDTAVSVVTLVAMAIYVPFRRESGGSREFKGAPDR